jgi:hypothetical protein
MTNGTFIFTLRVRDYHEVGAGVSETVELAVAPPPAPVLALSVLSFGANARAQIDVYGVPGQKQIIQTSSNLSNWTPIATNISGTNFFRFTETNAFLRQRFYRAIVP